MPRNNRIFVISGPSGVGKGTLVKAIFTRVPDLYYCVSATTRRRRKGDVEGRSYYFLDEDEFLTRAHAGEFLEWVKLYDDYYGTPRDELDKGSAKGKDTLLELDPRGALAVKEEIPRAVLIFVAPPTMLELERRLRGRSSESEEKLEIRLKEARRELESAKDYDYTVVNDTIENAVERVVRIIDEERGR